jgi:hypothetical protein
VLVIEVFLRITGNPGVQGCGQPVPAPGYLNSATRDPPGRERVFPIRRHGVTPTIVRDFHAKGIVRVEEVQVDQIKNYGDIPGAPLPARAI